MDMIRGNATNTAKFMTIYCRKEQMKNVIALRNRCISGVNEFVQCVLPASPPLHFATGGKQAQVSTTKQEWIIKSFQKMAIRPYKGNQVR